MTHWINYPKPINGVTVTSDSYLGQPLKLLPKLGCRIDSYQCDPPHSVTLINRPKPHACAELEPRQNIDAAPVHFGDKFPIKHALQDRMLLV